MYYRGTGELTANPYTPDGFDAGVKQGSIQPVEVEIQNVRGRDHRLNREGYVLVQHKSAVKNWEDDKEVADVYHKEVAELAKHITGARKCVTASHITRSTEIKPGRRPTASFVHNDFCDAFGPQLQSKMEEGLRTKLSDAGVTAEELKNSRLQMLSFWRGAAPGGGPILRQPLAVLDATSMSPADLSHYVYSPAGLLQKDWDMPLPVLLGMSTPSPSHRWGYYPRMEVDEVLVKLQFDSARPAPFNGVGVHAAFNDPTTPEDAPERISNECRVFCLFDKEPLSPGDVVTNFCNAWTRSDVDAILGAFAEDAIYHNMPMEPLQGIEAISKYIRGFFDAGGKVEFITYHQAAVGNVVLNERLDIINKGGKVINLKLMGTFEVERGKIKHWRDYFDLAQLRA